MQCDERTGKNRPIFGKKIAKRVAEQKNAKIFTSKLKLKVQNIYIKTLLKPKNS
jgi:hypothetical protein